MTLPPKPTDIISMRTQDGTCIAVHKPTGISAPGRTHYHAVAEVLRLLEERRAA